MVENINTLIHIIAMIPPSRRRFVRHILLLVSLPWHESLAFVPVASTRRQVVSTNSRCPFSPINMDHPGLTTRHIATTPDEGTPAPIVSSGDTQNSATGTTRSSTTTTTTTTTLNFWEHMMCGATSRSLAKTIFHPANVAKTILQTSPDTTVGACITTTKCTTTGYGGTICAERHSRSRHVCHCRRSTTHYGDIVATMATTTNGEYKYNNGGEFGFCLVGR